MRGDHGVGIAVAGALLAAVGLAAGAADALVGWGGTVALATSLLPFHPRDAHLLAPVKRTSAARRHVVVHPLRTRRAAVALRRGGFDGGAHMARLPCLPRRFFAPPPPAAAPAALEAKLRSLHAASASTTVGRRGGGAVVVAASSLPAARAPRRLFRSVALQLAAAPAASLAAGLNVRFEGAALDASGDASLRADRRARRGRSPQAARRRLAVAHAVRRRAGRRLQDGTGAGDGGGGGRGRRRRRRGASPWQASRLLRRAGVRGDGRARLPAALSRALLALLCDAPLTAADARGADPVLFRFRVDALLELAASPTWRW